MQPDPHLISGPSPERGSASHPNLARPRPRGLPELSGQGREPLVNYRRWPDPYNTVTREDASLPKESWNRPLRRPPYRRTVYLPQRWLSWIHGPSITTSRFERGNPGVASNVLVAGSCVRAGRRGQSPAVTFRCEVGGHISSRSGGVRRTDCPASWRARAGGVRPSRPEGGSGPGRQELSFSGLLWGY